MKRILVSILLVLTLIASSLCTVGAAGRDLTWIQSKFNGENAVVFNVTLEARTGANAYATELTSLANTLVDVRASVDMTGITGRLKTAESLADPGVFDVFKTKKIKGAFDLNVDLGTKFTATEPFASPTVEFTKNGTTTAVSTDNEVFKLGSHTYQNGVVTITLTLKELTVAEFLDKCPDKIIITQAGAKYTSRDATLSGYIDNEYTKVINADGSDFAEVEFDPEIINEVKITEYTGPGSSSGGGGSVKPKETYSLIFNVNGGSLLEAESYKQDQVVALADKVPVREGYVFDGWYADAALTEEVASVTMISDITVYAKWVKERHPVPESLNGADHFAYVIGYPDGTVRPNDYITRAEVTTIFFRLLKDEVRNANLIAENTFDDVNDGDWHNVAISTMAKLGIVNGRFENKFVPDANITRAEFTAICARFDDTEIEYEGTLQDIEGHWAEEYIKRASAYGWIEGYSDNTFRPDQFITRAESMTLINRVLNRVPRDAEDLLHDDMAIWSDNMDQTAWFYIAVQEATNSTEYERPNSVYKKWTEIIENRDWAELEESLKAEAPEEAEEIDPTEDADATEETEEPEVTEDPEVTEEPEVTEDPEVTEEPEVTEDPEVTEESEVTEDPEVTEEPEIVEEAENAEQSEASEDVTEA